MNGNSSDYYFILKIMATSVKKTWVCLLHWLMLIYPIKYEMSKWSLQRKSILFAVVGL